MRDETAPEAARLNIFALPALITVINVDVKFPFAFFQDSAYQTFTEWIDEEKVEEFNNFLDNQLQSKLGRGYNAAAASAPPSFWTATLSSAFAILLLLYNNNRQM